MQDKSTTNNLKQQSETLIINSAETKHIAGLTEVLVSSFYSFPQILSWMYPLLKLTIKEDLRYRLRYHPPLYCCLVAFSKSNSGSEIIGTVEIALNSSFWSPKPQYPYISNLAVKDSYRRQGVGKKLLTKCEQIAWNWGYRETRLHVLHKNSSAQKLYVSSGYKVLGIESSWNDFWVQDSRRLFLGKKLG
ncbi:MAG: GNAT family N-acetyltransferase [Xenococcaceae cyanobacterium MO_167.B27]|nr:GNAT family N-acetyltransferase [Xenococcaceae cyanobacterium MO_167.B27]